MLPSLEVLYEDNHLLVVYKPAGHLSQGDRSGDATILDLARSYLKRRYDKPGNVHVGVVHRLDRPVSGVLALARTSKAASRLSRQFRERLVKKVYRAVVEGLPPRQGRLEDWLKKNRKTRVVSVVAPGVQGARQAELEYRRLESRGHYSLLEIWPKTGRSHQIRVQLSAAGHPIMGDWKYGSSVGLKGRRIALESHLLGFFHPTRQDWLEFETPALLALTMKKALAWSWAG